MPKFGIRLFISAVIVALISANAFAYRPLGTEDASVAGKGVFQTEVSWDYIKWRPQSDLTEENILLFVPVYGLTESLEVSAEIPYLFHHLADGEEEEGVGDINLVFKYLLFQEGEIIPAFGIKAGIKLDNGSFDRGIGSGDKDYGLSVAVTKTFGPLAVHFQHGYTWVGDEKVPEVRDIVTYSLAMDYTVNGPLHLLAEVDGNRNPDTRRDVRPFTALFGASYTVSDKVSIDIGYKRGLNDESMDWGTTLGMTITY